MKIRAKLKRNESKIWQKDEQKMERKKLWHENLSKTEEKREKTWQKYEQYYGKTETMTKHDRKTNDFIKQVKQLTTWNIRQNWIETRAKHDSRKDNNVEKLKQLTT